MIVPPVSGYPVSVRLTPQNPRFYDLFAAAGATISDAAGVLCDFFDDTSSERRADLAARLRELEHIGDETTHDIMRGINTSFITPFDREDIALLAARLDDVLDDMEAAADLTVLYRIDRLPPGVRGQAALLAEAATLTAEAMTRLRSLADLESYWIAVNEVENRADDIYRALLADVFNNGDDVVYMIKVKEVIDQLEAAADAFEHVANVVQSIAAKES
jgi:predicted phosphate transport protein (TIGR00153 family)